MTKIILVTILSLTLIACNGGEDSKGSVSDPVYGLDFDYDMEHPEEIAVDPQGKLISFEINAYDMVTACGRDFYKDPTSGNIFFGKSDSSSSTAYVAKQMGLYGDYNVSVKGFQELVYEPADRLSVGRFVSLHTMSFEFIRDYASKTRVNFVDAGHEMHDNCMLYIDEAGNESGTPDVYQVDLSTEVLTSIF